MITIETPRAGTLQVDEDSILHLPAGLIGLPGRERFVLLEFGEGIPLGWLQCVDDPSLGLPVGDPSLFASDYRVQLPRAEAEGLGLDAEGAEAVFLIVTSVSGGGHLVTGNLRAPLIVNTRTRVGRQVVLDRNDLALRAVVDPVAFARAARGEGDSPDPAPPELAAR